MPPPHIYIGGRGGGQPWGAPSRRNPTWGNPPIRPPPFLISGGGGGKRGEGKGRGNPIPSISFPPPLFLSPLRSAHMGAHQPLVASVFPLLAHKAHIFCQGCPEPLSVTRYIPATPEHFRCLNTIILYMNLYLSTISRLLVMSVISYGTPNNIR